MSRRGLLDASPEGGVAQVVPVEIADPIVPDVPDGLASRAADGPVIGMFVIDGDGDAEAMAIDADLSAFWTPTARRLTRQLIDWCVTERVALLGDGYLTASLTADSRISDGWHVDDDQIRDHEGVGVVAIASNGDGPRLLTEAVDTSETRSGLPLALELADAESRPRHAVAPGHTVIFPQFGQVHRAPGPSGDPGFVRNLFVLRWATAPRL